jgi:hypothetical protein
VYFHKEFFPTHTSTFSKLRYVTYSSTTMMRCDNELVEGVKRWVGRTIPPHLQCGWTQFFGGFSGRYSPDRSCLYRLGVSMKCIEIAKIDVDFGNKVTSRTSATMHHLIEYIIRKGGWRTIKVSRCPKTGLYDGISVQMS